jgi:ribosomal protein S18 acetylase RimI-like enzyme
MVVAELRAVPQTEIPAKERERIVALHGRSRYPLEPPFRGEPPHAHFWHELAETAAANDATAVALLAGEEVRGLCTVRTPAWDAEHFGFVLGRIEHLVAADAATARAAVDWAVAHLRSAGARVATVRLYAEDHVAMHALEDAGFRFAEHALTPWRAMSSWQLQKHGTTRQMRDDDVDGVCAIARLTFSTDHFHTDPRFAKQAADGVYEKWIRTWHARPPLGGRSRVVTSDGRVAGFFLFKVMPPGEGLDWPVCHLVLGGMHPDSAGKGIGYTMYCDVIDDVAPDCRYATVTVATINPAVVNLYYKLGFRITSGGVVTLHRWFESAEENAGAGARVGALGAEAGIGASGEKG